MTTADAGDIVQDVFSAVAAHLETFHRDAPGDTFRGWLWTIARHVVSDHLAAEVREPHAAGGTEAQRRLAQLPAPDPCDQQDDADDEGMLLQQALKLIQTDFQERVWQAFWWTVVERRLAGEVATELGMSAAAVRQAKHRVLRRLREEFGPLID